MAAKRLKKIIKIRNWSALEKTLEQKPNILLSQFSIIAIVGCLLQVINDAYWQSPNGVLMDLSVMLIFILTYVLNEKSYHLAAKIVFILFGSSIIFIYAAIVPKSSAVYFIFFPLITINFLVFNNEQRRLKYAFAFYILLLLSILEVTNYQPFGNINITDGAAESTSAQVNLALAMFTVIFSLYNLDLINRLIADKRAETERDLLQKNEELKKANEELDYFVYSASHDLKAPLSSILGLTNISKYEIKDEKALEYIDRIENRVKILITFIKEVIEISRNSRTDIEVEALHLPTLCQKVINAYNYLEYAQEIEFKLNLLPKEAIYFDRNRLEIILNNVISNAIKYQRESNPNKKIELKSNAENNSLKISIIDNGKGIATEQQEQVFKMFFRGQDSKEGSGLGLYIVQNVVNKLNGKINLTSQENEGSQIDLEFPLPNQRIKEV